MSWLSYFNGDVASRYAPANQAGKGLLGTSFDQQASYAKIDASLSYTAPGGRYMVEAFGQNLTDHHIRTSASVEGTSVGLPAVFLSNYEPPRTWGVRVRANF